jgi:hypothetical protein
MNQGNIPLVISDPFLARGVSKDLVNMASQTQLSSLQAAVSSVTSKGIEYGKTVTAGGWEMKFAAPRQSGQLPALIHAQPVSQ